MAQIVSIHSYRRGTGKSSLVANLAILLAEAGKRVGIVEAAVQAPSLHRPFRLPEFEISSTLNEFLLDKSGIIQAVRDVTQRLPVELDGQVFLVPASTHYDELGPSLNELFQAERFKEGIHQLIGELYLDILLIDTQAGVNDDALIPIALSDTLIEILRLDQQDYQGTAVVVELAQKLCVQRVLLLVNSVSQSFDLLDVKRKIELEFKTDVAAVLPLSEDIRSLPSENIFVLNYPKHPLTAEFRQLALALI